MKPSSGQSEVRKLPRKVHSAVVTLTTESRANERIVLFRSLDETGHRTARAFSRFGCLPVTPGVQYCAGIGNRKVHHLSRR
jgi:hypothetical protein